MKESMKKLLSAAVFTNGHCRALLLSMTLKKYAETYRKNLARFSMILQHAEKIQHVSRERPYFYLAPPFYLICKFLKLWLFIAVVDIKIYRRAKDLSRE